MVIFGVFKCVFFMIVAMFDPVHDVVTIFHIRAISWASLIFQKRCPDAVSCFHRQCIASTSCIGSITKISPYNEDPLTLHFYIVKMGFTGVYIIFLFLL